MLSYYEKLFESEQQLPTTNCAKLLGIYSSISIAYAVIERHLEAKINSRRSIDILKSSFISENQGLLLLVSFLNIASVYIKLAKFLVEFHYYALVVRIIKKMFTDTARFFNMG